jgi:hypothetical protein
MGLKNTLITGNGYASISENTDHTKVGLISHSTSYGISTQSETTEELQK